MIKTFYIAGVQHRQGWQQNVKQLVEGQDLQLVPEPDNKYDPNAIKIMNGDIQLGYVPKKFSAEIVAAIDIYGEANCTLLHLNASAPAWESCEVEVEIDDESDEELSLEKDTYGSDEEE